MSFFAYFGTAVGTGLINSLITQPAVKSDWYKSLDQPCFTPPNEIFSWVWGLNYILISWSSALGDSALTQKGEDPGSIRLTFALQMLLMLLWTQAFFGNRNPKQALPIFGLLIFTAIWEFWILVKTDSFAAILFLPYLIWLILAFSINIAVI